MLERVTKSQLCVDNPVININFRSLPNTLASQVHSRERAMSVGILQEARSALGHGTSFPGSVKVSPHESTEDANSKIHVDHLLPVPRILYKFWRYCASGHKLRVSKSLLENTQLCPSGRKTSYLRANISTFVDPPIYRNINIFYIGIKCTYTIIVIKRKCMRTRGE